MSDELSPESRKSVSDYVRKIANQNELGEEVHEELVGHVEDRMLELLSATEPLTEEDAFILVREHLGKPRELKQLLRDVHVDATSISLVRRVLSIAIATLIASVGARFFALLGTFNIVYMAPSDFHSMLGGIWWTVCEALIGVGVLWSQTRRWKKTLADGKPCWVVSMSLTCMTALLAGAVMLIWLIPGAGISSDSMLMGGSAIGLTLQHTTLILSTFKALIWISWFDSAPYSAKRILVGGAAWVVFTLMWSANPLYTTFLLSSSIPEFPVGIGNWEVKLGLLPGSGYMVSWHMLTKPQNILLLQLMSLSALFQIAIALVFFIAIPKFARVFRQVV